MDEKIFNLLEKMYADLNSKIDNMNSQMQDMNENMATKKDLVRLENKMDNNHKALYEGGFML